MLRTISLDSYHISFGPIQDSLREFLDKDEYISVGVLVDELTREHCLPLIIEIVPDAVIFQIKSGEQNKTLQTCEYIWAEMAMARFDRHSLLINLGGGVIGDMGGFVASCYMRGIDFIQIPTTLLSQVDASVGGKLAVDFKGFKNLIGIFRNPNAVLIDRNFLITLPYRELRSGYAEMIKHGLINNVDIWNELRALKKWDHLDWYKEIFRSVHVKKEIVTQDPFEKGLRKILNFGHTIGHAIESISLQSATPLLHGEAIALGMVSESVLSRNLKSLSARATDEISAHIMQVYEDVDLSVLDRPEEIIYMMRSDKKNKGDKILFALIKTPGKCDYDILASDDEIRTCLSQTKHMLTKN